MKIEIDALITAMSQFTIKESNTEMVKITYMTVPEMTVDVFYKSPTKAKEMGIETPSSTDMVKMTLEGAPTDLKVTSVKYTGKVFGTTVK